MANDAAGGDRRASIRSDWEKLVRARLPLERKIAGAMPRSGMDPEAEVEFTVRNSEVHVRCTVRGEVHGGAIRKGSPLDLIWPILSEARTDENVDLGPVILSPADGRRSRAFSRVAGVCVVQGAVTTDRTPGADDHLVVLRLEIEGREFTPTVFDPIFELMAGMPGSPTPLERLANVLEYKAAGLGRAAPPAEEPSTDAPTLPESELNRGLTPAQALAVSRARHNEPVPLELGFKFDQVVCSANGDGKPLHLKVKRMATDPPRAVWEALPYYGVNLQRRSRVR